MAAEERQNEHGKAPLNWALDLQALVQTAQEAATRAQSAADKVAQPIVDTANTAAQQAAAVLKEIRQEVEANRKLATVNRHTAWINAVVELSKVPVLVAAIFATIYGANRLLGFDLRYMTKAGPDGITFDVAARQQLTALSAENDQNKAMVEALQKQLAQAVAPAPLNVGARVSLKAIEIDDTVSQRTLEVSRLPVDHSSAPEAANKTGYIWIGDQKNNSWSKTRIRQASGTDFSGAPASIEAGTLLRARGDLVLREQEPPNNSDYFRGVNINGLISSNTLVEALGPPVPKDREYAVQYWLKVRVVEGTQSSSQ